MGDTLFDGVVVYLPNSRLNWRPLSTQMLGNCPPFQCSFSWWSSKRRRKSAWKRARAPKRMSQLSLAALDVADSVESDYRDEICIVNLLKLMNLNFDYSPQITSKMIPFFKVQQTAPKKLSKMNNGRLSLDDGCLIFNALININFIFTHVIYSV